jgi:hypothetical protein
MSAFHDCAGGPTVASDSYLYESKVCRLGPEAFVRISGSDTLLRAIEAIHVLNRYNDPAHAYVDFAGRQTTPRGVARDLEATFDHLGFGMPACNPIGCDETKASGIRTFHFGALETLLGYRHGDEVSRHYADLAAGIALRVQIPPTGLVDASAGVYRRPNDSGGFYIAWDERFRWSSPNEGFTSVVSNLIGMAPEYQGVLTTNSETTFDGYAFLGTYDCLRFEGHCGPDSEKPVKIVVASGSLSSDHRAGLLVAVVALGTSLSVLVTRRCPRRRAVLLASAAYVALGCVLITLSWGSFVGTWKAAEGLTTIPLAMAGALLLACGAVVGAHWAARRRAPFAIASLAFLALLVAVVGVAAPILPPQPAPFRSMSLVAVTLGNVALVGAGSILVLSRSRGGSHVDDGTAHSRTAITI